LTQCYGTETNTLHQKSYRTGDGIDFYLMGEKLQVMPNWLRALIAGYGASKLGGGCFGTIIVFVLIYWLLGHC
jgi:hypothetical protein